MPMKKILVIVLTLIVLLSNFNVIFATDANAERIPVKVGYLENYGIITTPIVQGSEGYGYEYLEKIEEYTNYDFEYVSLSWADALEQLKSGEIDLLAPASINEERKEIYDFVDTIFSYEEVNIYALENDEYYYGEPKQLDGKILGVLEGSVYEGRFKDYAIENDLEYTIKYIHPATAYNSIISGETDFYIDGSLYLRDDMYSVDKIHLENLYLMTRKGNDSLNSTLNSAMLAIEAEQPYYNELLWYKYYSNMHKASQKLTVDEITALESKDVYKVGYHAYLSPISYTLPNGEPTGYAIDVMNLLADKLDIKIEYVALHDGTENTIKDIDFNLCPLNDECVTHGTLSEPYYTQNLLVVKTKGVKDEDVKNILVKDYATIQIEDYLGKYTSATIHKSYSFDDSKNIYETVDLDCSIIPDSSEILIDDKANKSISIPDISVPMGITVSEELPKDVYTALNKTIVSLKENTVDEIVMKSVLATQKEPTLMDALIEYQYLILSIFLSIVTLFIYVLWKSRRKTKRLLEVDSLTGTMTQYKFAKEAHRILSTAKPGEYMLVSLDIDKFKTVNKMYGTELGDKFLCVLAEYLKKGTTQGAIISRTQSDAFAILTKSKEFSRISFDGEFEKEQKSLGFDIPIYFSIGIYVIENIAEDISYMLDNARTAKAYGKSTFGNTVHYFTKELQSKHEKESFILSSMETALADEEFFIMVQPKVDLKTEKLIGGEVLVRWQMKYGTFIYPDEFIPLFEENKFIVQLDYYVLKRACEFISESKKNLPVISINISAITMLEDDFIKQILEELNHYGITAHQIEIELTESVLDSDFNRISKTISELKKVGFSIAIDDFGKGASSLARIKEIEIDVLKLDKEFMENNTENEKGKIVLKNIISLANDLGITSLAEGIETKEQQELLIELGCEQGQGYYFDRPLSADAFTQRIQDNGKFVLN